LELVLVQQVLVQLQQELVLVLAQERQQEQKQHDGHLFELCVLQCMDHHAYIRLIGRYTVVSCRKRSS
jgi:hypothetical protein